MTKARKTGRTKLVGTFALLLFAGAAASTACSDKFDSCEARRTCPPDDDAGGSGGERTDDPSGGTPTGDAGASTGGTAGSTAGTGGTNVGISGSTGEAGSANSPMGGSGGTDGLPEGGSPSGGASGGAGGSDTDPQDFDFGGAGGAPSCTAGETSKCGDLFSSLKGECRNKTIGCTEEGAWEDAASACGKARRDCASRADNDCDGKPDNTVDSTCPCQVGDVESCTVGGSEFFGECNLGLRTCVAGASGVSTRWGECEHSTPVSEVCDDGKDNDCDGAIDDGCACSTGEQRTCECEQTQTCGEDNLWTGCAGTVTCEGCTLTLLLETQNASAVTGACCFYAGHQGVLKPYIVDKDGAGYMRCSYDDWGS